MKKPAGQRTFVPGMTTLTVMAPIGWDWLKTTRVVVPGLTPCAVKLATVWLAGMLTLSGTESTAGLGDAMKMSGEPSATQIFASEPGVRNNPSMANGPALIQPTLLFEGCGSGCCAVRVAVTYRCVDVT